MKNMTKAKEDYLEAILILEDKEGKVHAIKVANFLKVSRAAVSKAMQLLLKDNLINMESYGEISLTDEGRKNAEKVYHRHTTIKQLLLNLGVSEQTAENDCCLIEHVISEETMEAIEKAIK